MNQHFTLGNINPKIYFLGVASCIGFVIAWLNRDGSSLTLIQLLIIWQAQTVGAIISVVLTHIELVKLKLVGGMNKWWQLAVSGLIGSILFAPFGLMIDIYLAEEPSPVYIASELLDEFLGLAPPLIFVWIAMNAPWLLGYRIYQNPDFHTANDSGDIIKEAETRVTHLGSEIENPSPASNRAASEDFFSLLPSDIGREIMHMEAELHYLKVETTSGEALILFNIKDAANLFDSSDGILCHRSHWVSKYHISAFQQIGRCGELTLTNGVKVPVSKRKLAEYKAWSANSRSVDNVDARTN